MLFARFVPSQDHDLPAPDCFRTLAVHLEVRGCSCRITSTALIVDEQVRVTADQDGGLKCEGPQRTWSLPPQVRTDTWIQSLEDVAEELASWI